MTQIKFEGNPCIKCGSTTRYISDGRCVACMCRRYAAQVEKYRARYAANPEKYREAGRSRYAADPEKEREAKRARRKANPEKVRAAANARYAANQEKAREYARARYAADLEKGRATRRKANRRMRAADPEKVRAANRAWRQANPDKALEIDRARRALRNGAHRDGTHRLWGERLKEHDGTCVHCGELRPLTLDHFVPLSKGGAHVLLNFVPSCKSCNSAKRDKLVEPTARIQAFLNGSLATCTRNQGDEY
jgi:5-methylcytosine-specific restriction endonuclease McrA